VPGDRALSREIALVAEWIGEGALA